MQYYLARQSDGRRRVRNERKAKGRGVARALENIRWMFVPKQ